MFTRRSLLAAAPAAVAAGAQPAGAESPAAEIRAMLRNSEANWNRGDLAAFASDYEDAPTTTFVGREVTRGGTAAILARYRRSYPTAEARGTLVFSEIEARPLCGDYAIAIGRFALSRTAAGGGDAAGRFSLVLRRTARGWKIILDHSS
ncbi:MAG: SgcJ/EcaC family oxidoreductase [Acidobacteriota bacterium]|nr:SgcJ/EcaC family oxidoreductase [Acidobacteriota bacterium]